MSSPTAKKRKVPGRKPGRPRGDTARQRERLLDAAVRCYAADGIAATSARQIAAAAGVTPALVNYYFGNKEQLLDAVIEERFLPVVRSLREGIEASGEDPRELATGFVRAVHAAVEAQPWLPSLWVREILSENGALRDLLIEQISPQVPRLLERRLSGAQRKGVLNSQVDPRLLVVSLVGLTFFPLAATPIWRRIFDATEIDSGALLRHTLALLEQGLGGSNDGSHD